MAKLNPCLHCGACCAYFRASFYWAEGEDASPGGVPVALTAKLTPFLRVMRGTDQPKPRCVALEGDIGHSVRCSIHPRRSSVCRDFAPSWEGGVHNPRCDKARAVWGLLPLIPGDWQDLPQDSDGCPPQLPRAA